MRENLPVLLGPDEELLEIETVDLDLEGRKKGEEIKWKGNPHIASKALTIIIGISVILLGLLSLPYGLFLTPASVLPILSFLSVSTGIIILFSVYIYMKYTRYVITDSAMYRQTGWLRKSVKRVPVDRLQTIDYKQSIPERILNFGTVSVSTAGTDDDVELSFDSVASPKEVHTMVNNLMEERVNRPRRVINTDEETRIEQLERELEELRETRD